MGASGSKEILSEDQSKDRSNYAGKVVLVTGCTHGIGEGLIESLIALPAESMPKKLILVNRNKELSASLATKIQTGGISEVSTYFADLSKPKEVLAVLRQILESEQKCDIAFLNTGAWQVKGEFSKRERVVQEDGYEYHFAVNYLQCVMLAQGLAPLLSKSQSEGSEGRIILTGSFTAFDMAKGIVDFDHLGTLEGEHVLTMANGHTYSQSKLLQYLFTKHVNTDLGGIAPNVTTNIVCPGMVKSNVEIVQYLFGMMGECFGSLMMRGQRNCTKGAEPLLLAGGSNVLKGKSGYHVSLGNTDTVYYAPVECEVFPQSGYKTCPSVIDKSQRERLHKATMEIIEEMKKKYDA